MFDMFNESLNKFNGCLYVVSLGNICIKFNTGPILVNDLHILNACSTNPKFPLFPPIIFSIVFNLETSSVTVLSYPCLYL